MDPGLIKLLEDDEEDESGPAVDADTVEKLKGVHLGNGSLKPTPSPASLEAPTASSVSPATGTPETMLAPIQVTQEQFSKMTPQQQQVYRQQHSLRQQLAQRQLQAAQQKKL